MTELMHKVVDAARDAAPAWLGEHRAAGREAWAASALPTRRTETWKYTRVDPLKQDFSPAEPAEVSVAEPAFGYPRLGGVELVFVDGFPQRLPSREQLPAGIRLVLFSEADEADAALVREHLGSTVDTRQHLFARLNDAALADGVLLVTEPGAMIETPIHLVWLTTERGRPFAVNQRLLAVAGAESSVTVVEHFDCLGNRASPDNDIGDGDGNGSGNNGGNNSGNNSGNNITNGITELILESGARLRHHRLHLEHAGAMHMGGLHARLDRDSTLESFHLALGSRLKRIDVAIKHRGPGAHCELNGIYLPRGRDHVDYHTCVEHEAPHCSTDVVFRGIVDDEAGAVFNGRIRIHPGAEKTRAELSNRNLLASDGAEVNTQPELEIYADDVQCAHGATVARLDPDMLHYLRAPGVPADEAEVMLSYGFINEIVDRVQLPALRDYLHPLLARQLSRDAHLARHLA